MATVEITPAEQGMSPIRLDVGSIEAAEAAREEDGVDEDFFEDIETRGFFGKPAAQVSRQLYEEAIKMACSVIVQTEQQLAALEPEQRPDEFEVTFALQVDAGLDVKVVHLGSEAQVQVRVQWNKSGG
jgi:Trypsin-co-occurring domain 1